jgi:aryl-alcohol dehydrogenase
MEITAAVVRERGGRFALEAAELEDPRDDEVLVRIAAAGICQTDLHARDGYYGDAFPAVYGHEGAGAVVAVGAAVETLAPGDHVVLSYPWCGVCPFCRSGERSYCLDARALKSRGTRADGSPTMRQGGAPLHAAFFQQSAFASHALATARNAVKVRPDAPLALLGPFGCGVQTGAGAVMNVMRPQPGDSFAVLGAGSVGLSGVMAARLAGCDPIVAVDVHESRLALAWSLGATHLVDGARSDLADELRRLSGGGLRFALETSAVPAVFRAAVDALRPRGTCVLVGSARPGTETAFEMGVVQAGRTIRGVIQGDARSDEFIPRLVDLLMAGSFPVDRLVAFYDFAAIEQAAADAAAGRIVKPVLQMPA